MPAERHTLPVTRSQSKRWPRTELSASWNRYSSSTSGNSSVRC